MKPSNPGVLLLLQVGFYLELKLVSNFERFPAWPGIGSEVFRLWLKIKPMESPLLFIHAGFRRSLTQSRQGKTSVRFWHSPTHWHSIGVLSCQNQQTFLRYIPYLYNFFRKKRKEKLNTRVINIQESKCYYWRRGVATFCIN